MDLIREPPASHLWTRIVATCRGKIDRHEHFQHVPMPQQLEFPVELGGERLP
jgi:hypothetical protein